MTEPAAQLRVALLAGTLDPGGAEKQLIYMARALLDVGVAVRVYSLTQGEGLEDDLRDLGVPPVCVGRWSHPLLRTAALARALRGFRPHVLQSAHFFTNLYVSAVAPLYRAIAIGSVRSDVWFDRLASGGWGRWLLRIPPCLLTNSLAGKRNAERLGVAAGAVRVISNVIDLQEFDRLAANGGAPRPRTEVVVAALGRLIAVKRLDRFVTAVALARREVPAVRGIIVGDGPERPRLQRLAQELGLAPDGMRFLGYRSDAARLLRHEVDVLMLTSDHEGFPNVVLEAMAAGLPIVTTPAGDAGEAVQDGVTGHVVPFDDAGLLAKRLVELAQAPERRRQLGTAGRRRVAAVFGYERLGGQLLAAYRAFAERRSNRGVLAELPP